MYKPGCYSEDETDTLTDYHQVVLYVEAELGIYSVYKDAMILSAKYTKDASIQTIISSVMFSLKD